MTTLGQMLSVFCMIFKYFNISSNTFLAAKTNQNEKKIAPPSLLCHGLPENAFQVNQLYNVTWSIIKNALAVLSIVARNRILMRQNEHFHSSGVVNRILIRIIKEG